MAKEYTRGTADSPGTPAADDFSGTPAFIFDMDGVLCDSEPLIAEAAVRMFAERHGVRVRPEDFVPFIGTGEDRYLGGVAEKYGVRLRRPEDKARVYEIYLALIPGRLKPIPGAVEFVLAARAAGRRTAIATSADRVKMRGNLREIRLPLETFDAIVTGEDIPRKKPAPDIFLLAARRLDAAPTHCVVVEDAINGVQAAKAAGARCLALATSFPADDLRAAGADWTAAGWDGLARAWFG
jgi:HAD superfamily hydrolase (TIGR01509 family)